MSSRLLELLAEQRVDWRIFGFLDERSYSLFIAASSSASGNADRRREPEAEPRPEVRTAAKARPAAPPSPERPPPQPVALRVPRCPPPLQDLTPNPRSRMPVTRAYTVWRLDGFASLDRCRKTTR